MSARLGALRYVLWPKDASVQQTGVFALVGGAVGLAGDLASFFTNILDTTVLAVLFLLAALLFAFLCLRKVFRQPSADEGAVAAVAHCHECDTMRFSLFAVVTFGLLMMIGQGQSATETVGERLGLIQRDLAGIHDEVAGLGDITRAQKIIQRPKTAQDYFANAWIYANIQRDPAKAHASTEALYASFSPKKLDAAELFFSTGRTTQSREALVRALEVLGERQQDATLLVVAARNAADDAETERLIKRAQQMDPDLPFAYWDIQLAPRTAVRTGLDAAAQSAMLRAQVADLTTFLAKISGQPTGRYFYLPQYQPDYEQLAQQTLASSQSALQTYKRLGY